MQIIIYYKVSFPLSLIRKVCLGTNIFYQIQFIFSYWHFPRLSFSHSKFSLSSCLEHFTQLCFLFTAYSQVLVCDPICLFTNIKVFSTMLSFLFLNLHYLSFNKLSSVLFCFLCVSVCVCLVRYFGQLPIWSQFYQQYCTLYIICSKSYLLVHQLWPYLLTNLHYE